MLDMLCAGRGVREFCCFGGGRRLEIVEISWFRKEARLVGFGTW